MRIAVRGLRGLCAVVLLCLSSSSLTGCADSSATTSGPTSGNGSTGTTTNVTVAVSPSATQTVDAGQTVALTATVTGDSSNRGVTWSLVNGTGTLSSTTASSIVYTSASASSTPVTVKATSNLDPSKSASATINVVPTPAFTSTGQLAQGFVGLGYNTSLQVTGGVGNRSFALAAGSALPAGLSLNTATGAITGTPTAAGSFTFSAALTDSAATPVTATASFTLGVSALQLNAPRLVNAVAGQAYPTLSYSAQFNQGAVTYAVTAGALPAGLSLSSAGVLSGTVTTAGTANFTVTATDAAGQKASQPQTITVVPVLALTGFTIPSVNGGTAIPPVTFAATGGTAPYIYTVAAGSALPAGLSLNPITGILSGTPSTPGNYTFAVTAKDAGTGTVLQTANATSTLTVGIAPLTISTSTLPNGVPGSPYRGQLAATGGIGPYSFAVTGGTLPAGITLSSSGLLSGRPSTVLGPSTFTVSVTDAQVTPATATKSLTLTIASTLTPGPNNAALKGSYAFLLTGQTNGAFSIKPAIAGAVYGADTIGSLTFDGTSLITGTLDSNSARFGTNTSLPVTGSYAVGSDNRGVFVLTVGGTQTITYNLALSSITGGIASRFSLIQADSDNPNNLDQAQGSGEAFLQTPSAFTQASLNGGYVFRLNGETPANSSQFGALSTAGYLFLNGSGLITRGLLDASSFNTAYQQVSMTGSYTAPDASGRGILTATPVSSSYPAAPTQYAYYIVSSKQILLMSIDAHATFSLMAGPAFQQQQTLYSTASLSGTVVSAENALTGGDGTGAFQTGKSAILYNIQITSNGQLLVFDVRNDNGTSLINEPGPTTAAALPGTYTVSDQGRVVFTINGKTLPVLWLYDLNKGVGTEFASAHAGCLNVPTATALPGCIGTVIFDGQTTVVPSPVYAFGTLASLTPANFSSGIFNNGAGLATIDSSFNGVLTSGRVTGASASTDSYGLFSSSAYNGFVINPTKIYFFDRSASQPVIYVGQQ